MAANAISWKFPLREFLVLRIEALFVGILAVLVLVFSLYQFNGEWAVAVSFTAIFLALYALLSYGIQKWRMVEERYKVTRRHLEVVRKKQNILKGIRFQTKKEKALLKDVVHHKLDKTFLGGYVVTKKGRKHLLFFNTREELEMFENFLNEHLKP